MRKKLLFIFNPHAGKAQIRNKLLDILDIFIQYDYEVTIHVTQKNLDAVSITQERCKGYDLLVCSGGDGTLKEVVTGLMRSGESIPIGYIPAGSTNDFANSLKISKHMKKAAEAIMTGRRHACDVGVFNDDYFVYIAAFGLFTDVSYQTSQEMKNLLGHMAYILEGVKRLFDIPSYHLEVECNGIRIAHEYIFGMVTNSISVGGFKNIIGPQVELDDGLFELTLIKRPQNLGELQEIVGALVTTEPDERYIHFFKTNRVVIRSEYRVPWTLDGEFGGEHNKVEIRNRKQGMEMIVESGGNEIETKN